MKPIKMEDWQRTSTLNTVNALWKRSLLCLALMFAFYPTLSHQELSANERRFTSSSKATNKIQKSPATLQHGISAFGSASLQMAAMTTGNATLESISERLVRLDDSLASVIQSILTVQRTVFNLEQLQELLVLLLEDILKQTGSVDKIPRTDTNPTLGGGNSGGTSLVTDSDETDSAVVRSGEVDEGAEDETVVANPDDTTGVVKVNGRDNEPTVRNSLALGPFGTRNEQFGMSALSQNSDGFPARQSTDPNKAVGRDDSAGDSSEGGRSNSNEDYSGGFMRVLQRSTQPANTPDTNSRRPQWSEPIMAHGVIDSNSRFFDVMNRMVSHLSQSGARRSPRLLGLMLGDSVSHRKKSESIFEHPPMYEPLEIVPSHDLAHSNEKKHTPRTFPIKVRLFPESVISHGGPLTGPEHHSSLYLEHPEHHIGDETTGETSTGMISNLVESNVNQVTVNSSDVITSEVDHVGQRAIPVTDVSKGEVDHVGQRAIPMTDVRRKREAFNNFLLDKNTNTEAVNLEFRISSRHNGTQHDNSSFSVMDGTPSRNVTSSTSSDNFTNNKNNIDSRHKFPRDNVVNASSSHGLLQEKVKKNNIGSPEYDYDIARLLTGLSTQLHIMHKDSDVSSDGDFSQALHELDKLIWVSTDSDSNFPVTFDVTNTSAVEQETESTDDVNKMTASGENILHTFSAETTHLNREFSGKHEHRNESSSLTTRNVNKTTSARKDSKSSNAYAMSLHEGALHRDMLISEQERLHLNGQEISTKLNVTTNSVVENMTANAYEEFDRLYQLLIHLELPSTNVKSLLEILNSLTRNDSFIDELGELNNRGRSMLGRTGDMRELEHVINLNTDSGVVNNSTAADNDGINDDSTLTSMLENSSSSEEDAEDADEEVSELRKTGFVENDIFQMSRKDDSPENVNHKDKVNFNHDEDVSYDHEENHESKESLENDDESDDVNSSDANEISQNVLIKRPVQENTDVWLLKTASVLEPLSQIKTQTTLLSASQAELGHPDDSVNNIENTFIYRKPRATKNKLHDTNAAIQTQIQRQQILNVISRQKRQVLQSKKQPHSNPSSRHIIHQPKALSQAQLSSGNMGVTTNHTRFSGYLVQSTTNANIDSQNASQSSSNVDVKKDTTPQQMNVKYGLNNSQNTDTHHTNAQDYGQIASNPHPFDPHVNGHSQNYIIPDYEYFGGTSSPEDRETPSAEEHSALDLEEVLTSLFLTYWQRFYHLYTRASPLATTPADLDIEEEVTETTLTTAASPVVTNVTADNSTYQASPPSVETGLDKEVSNTTSEHVAGG